MLAEQSSPPISERKACVITIEYQGKQVEAEEVGFQPISEPKCEFQLEDGTNIRMKLVVGRILKLVGEKNETGQQLYWFNNQITIFVFEKGK
jgi:hypothetical protein